MGYKRNIWWKGYCVDTIGVEIYCPMGNTRIGERTLSLNKIKIFWNEKLCKLAEKQ